MFCYFGVSLKARFGFDDSLDVVGIHGVGGIWGALATGLFASQAINPAGFNGLFYGQSRSALDSVCIRGGDMRLFISGLLCFAQDR